MHDSSVTAYLIMTSRIQQRTRQEVARRTAPTITRGLMNSTESIMYDNITC